MDTVNTIAYADEWADEARKDARLMASVTAPGHYSAALAAVQERARAETPMYLGIVESVNYLDKSDRYVVKFGGSSVKVTADVAQFLLTHAMASAGARPTVYAKMTEGVIVRVLLLFLSRD